MNNEIKNEKVQVPNGVDLNDKDYLNSLLSCLKEMTKNFTTAMTEASNDHLYEKYEEMFEDVSEMQREVYEVMFQNGWYQLETAEANKIKSKLNTLDTEFMDLNNDDEA